MELSDGSNNRVSFDNLSWTCYDAMATGEADLDTQKLSIYPNPVKNHAFYVDGLIGNQDLLIYNVNGQLVQKISQVKNRSKVKLDNLPRGIYIVKTKNQSAKVIID